MNRALVLVLCLSFAVLLSHAGNYSDSLKKQIPLLSGKKKVEVYNAYINIISVNAPQEGIRCAAEALKYATETGDEKGVAHLYLSCGKCLNNLGKSAAAYDSGMKALLIFKKLGDRRNIASAYTLLGISCWNMGNYEKTLENNLLALKCREALGDEKELISSYNNLGIIYQQLKKNKIALDYYLKSFRLMEKNGKKNNTGSVLNNIGSLYGSMNNQRQALSYFLKALNIHNKNQDTEGLILTLTNLGVTYNELNDYVKSIEYFKQSLELSSRHNNPRGIAMSALNVGSSYLKQKKYDSAIEYLSLGLKTGTEIGAKDIVMNACSTLATLYQNKKEYKKALDYYQKYTVVKDSLFNEQSNRNIAELEAKYESEKKDKENQLLAKEIVLKNLQIKRRETMMYSFIGGAILLAIIILVVLYAYFEKNKTLQKEKALNRIRSRFVSVVSHEFRTPLAGIYSSTQLLQNFHDRWTKEQANEFFQKIYDSIRHLKTMLDEVSLIDKGQNQKLDFHPEKLNFESFCKQMVKDTLSCYGNEVEIQTEIQSDIGIVLMDGILMQHILTNLLSNAVKYSQKNTSILFKTWIEKPGEAGLLIQDHGIGIPEEDIKYIFDDFHRGLNVGKIQGTGLGMSIVKKCIDLHKGRIEIKSEVDAGTSVKVFIPFEPVEEPF